MATDSAVRHIVWRQKAMVRREVRTHCSIVRLAKQRESLGVGCLADLATLPPGCRKGFVEELFSARVPKSSAEYAGTYPQH